MAHHPHHEHLIKEMAEMYAPVFKHSPQAVYVYLDDEHKICNEKLAKLLGYKSPQEWVDNQYPLDDVAEADKAKVVAAYMDASRKLKASRLTGTFIRQDGKKIKAEVIMAPVSYSGEVFVVHFISLKK